MLKNQRSTAANIVGQLVFGAISLLTLFPIYYIVTASLKTRRDYLLSNLGIPLRVTLENFRVLFVDFAFTRWFANSLLVTGLVLLIGILICCLAAFGFRRFTFRFKGLVFRFIISLMLVPPIVALVPLFEFFVRIRLVNSLAGVTLIYIGFILPFTIYLIHSFFITIPDDLVAAAIVDGCRNLRMLFRIFVPLSAPAIVTSVVVNALWVWNDLLIAMVFLQNDRLKTLMAGLIAFRSRSNINLPLVMAGLLVSTIPIVALFLAGQRFFIKGLMAGIEK